MTVHEDLTAVLDAIGAMVIIIDAEGCVAAFNDACVEFTGIPAEKVLGRPFAGTVLKGEEAHEFRHALAAALARRPPRGEERRWADRHGRSRLIRWTTRVVADATGTPVRHITGLQPPAVAAAVAQKYRWRCRDNVKP